MSGKWGRFRGVVGLVLCVALGLLSASVSVWAGGAGQDPPPRAVQSLSAERIMGYVREMCAPKYGGRLTGTAGYNASAQWLADQLKKWGVEPAGEGGTYYQDFPNPYTLVLDSGHAVLHKPGPDNTTVPHRYRYETEYFPGSTSGNGEVKAGVVYVGYGITAPELGYDDYKGVDVRGKIVLMEPEVPVSPALGAKVFKKWRPYSFHQYKVRNAHAHGAAGMLYHYHIANPNCLYIKDFILTYVGNTIVNDLFAGTGREHEKVLEKIKKHRKPGSFDTGKVMSLRNATEHHPEGIARNVMGVIRGSDPVLKNEVVLLGAHLDHLGYNHELFPGANDNASGVAVLMEVARVLKESGMKPGRSVMFVFFGAEEQGVKGSEYYVKHPVVPLKSVVGFFNLDGVGRGQKLVAQAARNYPDLWKYIKDANGSFVRRRMEDTHFHNLARPRLDAAHFMWAGVPTISFRATGAPSLPNPHYHRTTDTPEILTPQIMEDLARILFVATIRMGNKSLAK